MPRLRPALLTLSLLALLLGLFGFREYRVRQALAAALAQEQARALAATNVAATLRSEVDALDTALGEARTRLTVAVARQVELGRDLTHTRAQVAGLQPLHTENIRLTSELAQATAQSSALVSAYEHTMAEVARQLSELARPAPASSPVLPLLITHRSRNAQVSSVGPSSAFVIINYGATHGALLRQEMLILRGTETVARVQISDVRDQHSIAQVLPDSLSGVLHKGDSAVLSPPSP